MDDFFNSRKWKQFLKENKVSEACGDMPTVADRGPVHTGLEKDHEGEMARSQLMGASESAAALMDMIQEGDELPAWLQSKLTKAADYLNMARRYMEYQSYKDSGTMGAGQAIAVTMQEGAAEYSPLAQQAAEHAVSLLPQATEADGAAIENEVYGFLESLPEVQAMEPEQLFALGDEALSAAGVMLGLGPDVL